MHASKENDTKFSRRIIPVVLERNADDLVDVSAILLVPLNKNTTNLVEFREKIKEMTSVTTYSRFLMGRIRKYGTTEW